MQLLKTHCLVIIKIYNINNKKYNQILNKSLNLHKI